jgi:hypothetical protein
MYLVTVGIFKFTASRTRSGQRGCQKPRIDLSSTRLGDKYYYCLSLVIEIADFVILFFQIVQDSPYLTMDLLESCFPYALLRKAYQAVFRSDNVTS